MATTPYENSWRRSSSRERCTLLKRLRRALSQREQQILDALAADFGKPKAETLLTEIYPALGEIRYMEKHLAGWMEDRWVGSPWLLSGTGNRIVTEAKGRVLVLSPWNYPFQLALVPVAQALAAGNLVTLKPSEHTPHTSKVLKEIFAEVCPDLVTVKLGGADVAEALLQNRWDHVFFTGSTRVGKIVAEAAARTLSPVTLELGGKSPAVVTSDVRHAAKSIAWGKLINGGQTCVAPDYVITTRGSEFLPALRDAFTAMLQDSPIARPITPAHEARWNVLLQEAESEGAQVERFAGGAAIVLGAPSHSRLMQEEIFGPILPVVEVPAIDAAIREIRAHPTPLALYVFGSARDAEKILKECPSGGACVGETLLHLGNPELPFGGLGESGQGRYHGEFGFRTFSHERAVLTKGLLSRLVYAFHPPYSRLTETMIRWATRLGL